MTTGDDVFGRLQRAARVDAARTGKPVATQEYLTLYALEAFLDRLTRTDHTDDFVLKGGILLAVYGFRRPTRDIDSEALRSTLNHDRIARIVRDIAEVDLDDGVEFDLDRLTVREIRENVDYPGVRMRVPARLGSHHVVIAWDISTGDPIVPAPQPVKVPRILGGEIDMLGYAPETTIAEKGVTILERGTTSTRWRDFVDIVQLDRHHAIDRHQLHESAQAIALYRHVQLGPIGPVVAGYGAIAQAKWAAWRRKEHVEDISEPNLDDQIAMVAQILDPAFTPTTDHTR